jgi:hypothetical protein
LSAIYPNAIALGATDELSAEQRLQLLEASARSVEVDHIQDESQRRVVEFMIGYIASKVGGGWRNIDLAMEWSKIAPLAPVWFGIVHSLSEREIYGARFDGVSRLVLRELECLFHLRERPKSDISVEELQVAVSSNLKEKIQFRTANSRAVLVELLPGVPFTVALDSRRDQASTLPQQKPASAPATYRQSDETLSWLVNELDQIKQALREHGIIGDSSSSLNKATVTNKRVGKRAPKGRDDKLL